MATRPLCSRGFTLLELLVALAVFSVVSMMAYGGLRSVLEAKSQTEQRAERLAELQMAMLMIERDVSQTAPRGIRDIYGDPQPPLLGGEVEGVHALELTRAGWSNPTGRVRSSLQRVGYRLDGQALMRDSWQVLDRAQDSEPYRAVLLTGVEALSIRFMDGQLKWQEAWPPQSFAPQPDRQSTPPQLPVAIELTVELDDFGEITRLFRVAEPGP